MGHQLIILKRITNPFYTLFPSPFFTVKLFDFGLARVIPKGGNANVDVFEMSGAGTPRRVDIGSCYGNEIVFLFLNR